MSSDSPRWRSMLVLREFHEQWWRARGRCLGKSARPFRRDWEELLSSAGLLSAELRAEAGRDVQDLAAAGLIEVIPVAKRAHLIASIRLPVANEERLALLFGDPLEAVSASDFTSVAWEQEMQFVLTERVQTAPADLLKLNEFFAERGAGRLLVPIKERSVSIFGDEKRLDAILSSTLRKFLSLEVLRCYRVAEPLGWKRGPQRTGCVLVIENLATWYSFCRWNASAGLFSAVIYGAGYRFLDGIPSLSHIAAETGAIKRILYFGDLDRDGLSIPVSASKRCWDENLPQVEPFLWAYKHLLEFAPTAEADNEDLPVREDVRELCCWLQNLREPAQALLEANARIAQERFGWERLQSLPAPDQFQTGPAAVNVISGFPPA